MNKIEIIEKDIFEGSWNAMIQVCNPVNIWGSGIVIPIKEKFPEAYEADLKTKELAPEDKYGNYTCSVNPDTKQCVVNLYAMTHLGAKSSHPDGNPKVPFSEYYFYKAIKGFMDELLSTYFDDEEHNLNSLVRDLITSNRPIEIGVPYGIGCLRAAGDWDTVLTILNDIQDEYSSFLKFVIYKLPTK